MRRLYWRIRIILLALRWVRKFNLGDTVWYEGEKWILYQGVSAPRWKMSRDVGDIPFADGGKRLFATVHERDFRKVRTVRNYWGSFASGYRFYMQNWYGIWVNEGIKDWMLGCKIWGKKR